jgi:hypothetical protein
VTPLIPEAADAASPTSSAGVKLGSWNSLGGSNFKKSSSFRRRSSYEERQGFFRKLMSWNQEGQCKRTRTNKLKP